MKKIKVFEDSDKKQIPLFYDNLFQVDKDLIERIELGVKKPTTSRLHRSTAYQRYKYVCPVSLLRLDDLKNER